MSQPQIIKVVPTEEYFSINWQLEIRCNYDCMYCSPRWHDNHSRPHSLETMQQAWQNIFAKTQHLDIPYKIAFTGGELTANKNFLPFLRWLKQHYHQHLFALLLTTNGSATYKYYCKMFELVDNITFSVHSEHINEQKFFDMVIKLKQTVSDSKFIHVSIMDEFWNQSRIPMYTKLLDQHCISYNVKEINYSVATREQPIFLGKLNLAV